MTAELDVRMEEGSGGLTTTYRYEFRSSSPEGHGPLEQEYVAEPNPALLRQLCEQLDEIVQQALGPTPVGHNPAGDLADTGKMLYNVLFPRLAGNIPDLAKRLSGADGPLLVRTNESVIPWELLHDGKEFLALAHDLGRHTFVKDRVLGGRTIGTVARALIVGDPIGDLASARREAERIAEWLDKRGVDCTLVVGEQATMRRVIKELASGRYDLLHYCGHVDVPSDPRFVGLRLHDNQLLDGRALAPLAEFGAPPIVFINGCASAARITNLCVSFMVMGAKAVVGTRYEVAERRARRFAERFYVEFLSGSSAGAAIRAARTALWQPPAGVDWAAFVLYGDPSVRISTSDTSPPPPPPPPPPRGYALDSEAQQLMDKVAEQAAPRGVATSMDLLIHLLSTQDIRARATDQDAAVHLALAGEVLRAVLDTLSTAPGSATVPVEYSDTVKSVLDRAGELAHQSGRELISINDLVTAFTAVGGGSSRQMLDLFGISLDKLAGMSRVAGGLDTERRKPSPTQESVVQKVPLPESNGHPRAGVLLDESGCLRVERLRPTVVTAVRAAAFLASGQRSQISTSMLLCGLAVADSARLREALHEQGAVGVAALRQLTLSAATHGKHFSSRTLRALERAASGAEPVDDEALLREILSEPDSSARILLQRLGVDADRLRGDGSGTPHAADA